MSEFRTSRQRCPRSRAGNPNNRNVCRYDRHTHQPVESLTHGKQALVDVNARSEPYESADFNGNLTDVSPMHEEGPTKTTNVLFVNRRHVNREDNIATSIKSNWRISPEFPLTSIQLASRAEVPEIHIRNVQPREPNPCYASPTHRSVTNFKTESKVWQPNGPQRNAAPNDPQRNAAPYDLKRNAAPYDLQRNAVPYDLQRNAAPYDLQRNAAPNDPQRNAAPKDPQPNAAHNQHAVANYNSRRHPSMPFAGQAQSLIRAPSCQRKPMNSNSPDDNMQRDLSERHGVSEHLKTDANKDRQVSSGARSFSDARFSDKTANNLFNPNTFSNDYQIPHLNLTEHRWLPTGSNVICDQTSSLPCELESETYRSRRQPQDQNDGNSIKETDSHNSNYQLRNANKLQNRSRSQEHSSLECTGVNTQQCKNSTEFANGAQHSKSDSVTHVPDVRSKAVAGDFRYSDYIGTFTDSVNYKLTLSMDSEEIDNQMTRYSEHGDKKSEMERNGVTDIVNTFHKTLEFDRAKSDTRTSLAFQTVRQNVTHECASQVDHNASSNEIIYQDNGVQRGVGKGNTPYSHAECLDVESRHMYSSDFLDETKTAINHIMSTRERLQSGNVSRKTIPASSNRHSNSQMLQKDKGMDHNHRWQRQTIENVISENMPALSFIYQNANVSEGCSEFDSANDHQVNLHAFSSSNTVATLSANPNESNCSINIDCNSSMNHEVNSANEHPVNLHAVASNSMDVTATHSTISTESKSSIRTDSNSTTNQEVNSDNEFQVNMNACASSTVNEIATHTINSTESSYGMLSTDSNSVMNLSNVQDLSARDTINETYSLYLANGAICLTINAVIDRLKSTQLMSIPVQRDFQRFPPIDSRLNPSANEFFPPLADSKDQLTDGILGNPVNQTKSSSSDEHLRKVPTGCPPLQSRLNSNASKYFPTFGDCNGNPFLMARHNNMCYFMSLENAVIRIDSNTLHEQDDLVDTADNILNSSSVNIMPIVDTTFFPIQELQRSEGYGSDKFYNGYFMGPNDAPYFSTTHMVYNTCTQLPAYFPEHFTEPTVPASNQVHPTANLLSNIYYNETLQYFTQVQPQPNQLLLSGTEVQMHPHNPYTNPEYTDFLGTNAPCASHSNSWY